MREIEEMQAASKYSKHEPLEMWSNTHAVFTVLATIGAIIAGSFVPLVVMSLLSFSYLIYYQTTSKSGCHPFSSIANYVTGMRFLLVIYCLSNYQSIDTMWLFAMLFSNILLDVLDGYLARKYEQTSEFGRVFDMEIDAFFVNGLGLYFLFTTEIGYLILLPGLLRYAYRLVVWLIPQPGYQESKKFYAAALAGVNFVLIVLAVITPTPVQTFVLFISVGLVTLSFSVSFYEFFRHARTH